MLFFTSLKFTNDKLSTESFFICLVKRVNYLDSLTRRMTRELEENLNRRLITSKFCFICVMKKLQVNLLDNKINDPTSLQKITITSHSVKVLKLKDIPKMYISSFLHDYITYNAST